MVQTYSLSEVATQPLSSAGHTQLILAALAGIAAVVLLIVWARFHPFIGLILGTAVLAAVAAVPPLDALDSFITGLGDTFGEVGLLIALGAMLGKLLADSGGANRIVDGIVDRVGPRNLPWAMALVAGIIGLPMFFEIGVVLLVPIVVLVSLRTTVPLMKIGIPALAGLSILHGLVPPHPGPETAIQLLHAQVGYTLIFGLIVAVPTLIIAGPLLAQFVYRLVPLEAGNAGAVPEQAREQELVVVGASTASGGSGNTGRSSSVGGQENPRRTYGGGSSVSFEDEQPRTGTGSTHRPAFAVAILCMVLPVALMLVRAIFDLSLSSGSSALDVVDFIGDPSIALLVAILVAMFALGRGSGMLRGDINESLGSGLPAIASIMLIVAAGGGFKEVLSDSGVSNVIADDAKGWHISVLLLGWLVAVAIRLATGSATVATVTTAGIVGPLAHTLDQPHLALLVLAIGSGSLFFSHVNDAGFWLVKEYFGMTVWQTIKSWSVMETVVSVVGFGGVMVLNAIV
ncbi:MAG TPA: SLC13 family permease [Jatrophihabitans sp.]|nr:SLC13 family permease [Jatrophihabitans sp.]